MTLFVILTTALFMAGAMLTCADRRRGPALMVLAIALFAVVDLAMGAYLRAAVQAAYGTCLICLLCGVAHLADRRRPGSRTSAVVNSQADDPPR